MSDPQEQPDERLADLAIMQVTAELSAAEQRELDAFDGRGVVEYNEFENAAAAVCLAAIPRLEALPQTLRQRLERDAASVNLPASVPAAAIDSPRPRSARSSVLGWWAAAACLLLAAVGWLRAPPPAVPLAELHVTEPPAVITAPVLPVPPPKAPPTDAEARAALLAREDAMKVALGATKDPVSAGVRADVVWDSATQTGFVHVIGLAPNDRAVHQYQMWVFDAERDKRYPVDGGVFDVPPEAAEIVVPIRAGLYIHKPAAFAVTLEKAGGVVVSGREHVIALGTAG